MSLILSFDIGYASIGWCVLRSEKGAEPEFRGTGVVTFPTDDCLASQRRALRRTRRHIRSTRQRIENMKRWLSHRGVLSRDDLDKPGHPAPFLLAAAALAGHKTLSAWELWTVLRWYAHNRGYDGNTRWSRGEEEPEDTEKLGNARALMEKHGTTTMAATVCACLGLDPAEHDQRISSTLPYKTLNAAYPRTIVEDEVCELLARHRGKIKGLDDSTATLLLTSSSISREERAALAAASIHVPRRYHGGLLFGQLVPRFDNRIIARCPIIWATTYDEAIANGGSDSEAQKLADKYAKVPVAKSQDFLEYRFARVLANLTADGKPLPADLRRHLWDLGQQRGHFTAASLKKELRSKLGGIPTNADAYFKLHPDAEKQLVLDPAQTEASKAEGSRSRLNPIWPLLPETTINHALAVWKRGRGTSLEELIQHAGMVLDDFPDLPAAFAKANKPKRGEAPFVNLTDYLRRTVVRPDIPSGRAPYARPVLRQVVIEVLEGFDPTRPARSDRHPDGEIKPADGVLYAVHDPSSRVRQLQAERPLDELTNNHLVRHRLLILQRLIDDIVSEFVSSEEDIGHVVVEVARELKEFSGMTAKQIAAELNSRLKDFKAAVAYLEKNAPQMEISGGLLRKCRIAMDLGWTCPFTGKKYDPYSLSSLDREHIIPYATRSSNALSGLVLTFPEVNRMKGKRTARAFIEEFGGKQVDGKPELMLFTPRQYESFVDKLDAKGHDDDRRRKKARKALLMTADFTEKENTFTEGQLTQSSQLMKLAMASVKKQLPEATVDPIPGPVTAEIRKSWDLVGTMALGCPDILDAEGNVLPKNEIRGITHLHHALDAATLALAAHYFPLRKHGRDQKGKLWQALLKRRRTDDEKEFLLKTGIFNTYKRTRRDKEGNESLETDVRLRDLDADLKESLSRSLAECRVMQHIPADRSGVRAELTTWGIVSIEGEGESARVKLRQRATTVEDGRRKIDTKSSEERAGKLLGTDPTQGSGKLKAINGAVVIRDNYGLALDPEPTVIPFYKVQQRLDKLFEANNRKPVRLLRNGMLIRIQGDRFAGVWMIRSIKDDATKGPLLDLTTSQMIRSQGTGKVWSKRDVRIRSAIKAGLEILPHRYTGHPLID